MAGNPHPRLIADALKRVLDKGADALPPALVAEGRAALAVHRHDRPNPRYPDIAVPSEADIDTLAHRLEAINPIYANNLRLAAVEARNGYCLSPQRVGMLLSLIVALTKPRQNGGTK